MKNNIYKDMSEDQLVNALSENMESLQNLKFQQSFQQLEDTSQISKVKKNIARVKTIINLKNITEINKKDNV